MWSWGVERQSGIVDNEENPDEHPIKQNPILKCEKNKINEQLLFEFLTEVMSRLYDPLSVCEQSAGYSPIFIGIEFASVDEFESRAKLDIEINENKTCSTFKFWNSKSEPSNKAIRQRSRQEG